MKLDNKKYKDIYLRDFNILKKKLMSIFSRNPNTKKFKFYGVEIEFVRGLYVEGVDTDSVRTFTKFLSAGEIERHYRDRIFLKR